MKYLVTILIVLAVLIAGAFLYAWSGLYNMAASKPHWNLTSSFIEMVRDRSIETHSQDIQRPGAGGTELKDTFFSHYHGMCRLCHGAPGYRPEEFAMGLYPKPPEMTSGEIQTEFNQVEIYWIVEHGLKLTGMPAFGPSHDEEDLWGLAALARAMPGMSPEQYNQRVQRAGPHAGSGQSHEEPEGESGSGRHGEGETEGHGET
ncbi:MAG: cytochrome c [Desulfohalobiaceae bacterium]|nr:cytochrome c [Desulfohalobiaceae bacterium]